MSEPTAQQLYDLAFDQWKANEFQKAREYVEEALKLSPEDLNIHALAMHIKFHDIGSPDALVHAEFIMDHDINYNDTLSSRNQPHDFIDTALFMYYHQITRAKHIDKNKEQADEAALKNYEERYCLYTEKVLRAGYKIHDITDYIELLTKYGHYDKALDAVYVLLQLKSSQEAGLPGLDEYKDFDPESLLYDTGKIFHKAQRYVEARDFYLNVLERNPRLSMAHRMLAEFYCILDQPAESARRYILYALETVDEDYDNFFNNLCRLVKDPLAVKKTVLYERIKAVSAMVNPEIAAIAENLGNSVLRSMWDPKEKLMNIEYIESKIGMALPPEKEEYYYRTFGNLWIPSKQGKHPYKLNLGKHQEVQAAETVTAQTSRIDPHTIRQFGIDITELARAGKLPPITGRDREIDSLLRILLRMEKNNPVLLGAAGVGKTAILQGLAQRIISEHVPEYLKNRIIVELAMSTLVGGTTYRGDFESRITQIIDEARDNPEIILFVDELHTIMGAGASMDSRLDVANIVKPALAKGSLRMAGATTSREYGICIEKDPAMARRFTPVRISEMDRNATIEVLHRRREVWRDRQKMIIPDDVVSCAVDLAEARVKNRTFPDKAIDLLDESCAFARTHRDPDENGCWVLTLDEVHHVLQDWTGGVKLPAGGKESSQLKNRIPSRSSIREQLCKKIIGQNKAVDNLVDVIFRLRLSLKDSLRPVSVLLHGPAGSGKATCCDAVRSVLWPEEPDRLLSINMAEFSEETSLYRLIGPPPGYRGFDESGILTARLKQQAHSIIILKNLPAAHHRVHLFFEQLFRRGCYTDATGREILAADALFMIPFDSSSKSGRMGFSPELQSDKSTDGMLGDCTKSGIPEKLNTLFTFRIPLKEPTDQDIENIIRFRIETLKDIYNNKGISLIVESSIVRLLTDKIIKLPPGKRDIEKLIAAEIGPKIRNLFVNNSSMSLNEIVIR